MWKKIAWWFWELLSVPSSFRAQPWKFARNQTFHGYLIGGLPVFFYPDSLVIVAVGYMVWEQIQILGFDGEPSDSLEDFAHVMTIGLAAQLHEPALVLAQLMFLAAGIMWRVEEKQRGE